jgi:large subunit ribosomal protein L17
MRHRKKINHLSRKSAHRKAMLANMAASLIIHKRINTTLAKAKALRTYIEPLITKSKEDTTHSRRIVFSHLQNKEAVAELFRDISVKVAERPGGYTRIIKTGTRLGDSAEMCMMELVDFNENLLGTKESAKEKPSRRRRGAKKPAALPVESKTKQPAKDKVEEPLVEDEHVTGPDGNDQEAQETVEQQPDNQKEDVGAENKMETPVDKTGSEESLLKEEESPQADEPKDEPGEDLPDETTEKDTPK